MVAITDLVLLSLLLLAITMPRAIRCSPRRFRFNGHDASEDHDYRRHTRKTATNADRRIPMERLQQGRLVALTSMTHYTIAANRFGLVYSKSYTRHLTNPEVVFTMYSLDMNSVVFKSVSNDRYLMIDRRGRIRTTVHLTYRSIFIEKHSRRGTSSFTSYVERSRRWHLSINRRGRLIRNRRRQPSRKLRKKAACFHIRLM